MRLDGDETMGRREFLRRLGRYLLGGVLGVGVWTLVRRPEGCTVAAACAACGEFSRCEKPEAQAARGCVTP